MTYTSLMATVPRLLSTRDTEDYVCGPTMLKLLCTEWRLRPFHSGTRLTVYDRLDIDAAIERKKIADAKANI